MDSIRIDALTSLVGFSKPIQELEASVRSLEWDAPEPLVTLSLGNVASVLLRHFSGELSIDDVVRWSELIEGREDIEYSSDRRDILRDAIYKLANPDLHGGASEKNLLDVFEMMGGAK
jgi:hypothetical protein